MRGEQNSHRTLLLAMVQTVKFDDLDCRQSDSLIWSADCEIRRLREQTVRFNDWECRPSNSTVWSADRRIR